MFPSRCRNTFLGAVLLARTTIASGQEAAPETVVFEFLPPDSVECVQTLITERDKTFEGLGRQVDRSVSRTSISLRHRGDGGFEMVAKTISFEVTRDGRPIEDPVSGLLADAVVTTRISADGQLESVQGYEGLVEKVRATMPEAVARAIAPTLNHDALVARETAEWNARVGDFVGAEMVIGDTVEVESPFTLPNGQSLLYRSRITLRGREPCPLSDCVRIDIAYDTDAKALSGQTSELLARVWEAAGADSTAPPAPTVQAGRVSGAATRLIDPKTMLIYAETVTRTMWFEMDVPGKGKVPAVMKDERRYEFTYGAR